MIEDRWLVACARVFERYLSAVAPTIRTTLFFDGRLVDTGLESSSDLGPGLASIFSSQSLLLPFWNAHSILLVGAYLSSPSLYEAGRRFQATADDSLGGRVTQLLFRQIGLPARKLSIASQEQRLEDLREILANRPNLIMAADSHGPYRSISPGMARIVRSYDGNVRPLSAVCSKSFPVFRRVRMRVPLPKARIIVGLGPSLGKLAVDRPLLAVREGVRRTLADFEMNLLPLLDAEFFANKNGM